MTRQKPAKILRQILLFSLVLIASGISFLVPGQNGEAALIKLKKCTEYRTDSPLADALAGDSQRLYAGAVDGSVQAIDAAASAGVWRSELGGEIISNIILSDGGVLVISNSVKASDTALSESVLRSLSKETGVPNWTARLPFSERFFIGKVAGTLIAVSREGAVHSIDLKSGRVNWRTQAFGTVTARPYFSQHGTALGTAEKLILVISAEAGNVAFKGSLEFVPTAVTNPTAEILVAGDERGNVASIDVSGGKNIWKFKSGGAISFVAVTKEGLVITSLDNFIYLISMYNGDVIWKRRLSGRVVEGGVVFDGLVFVLIYGENSGFLIDSKKGKVLDQLPQSEDNLVGQIPALLDAGKFAVATAGAVTAYSVDGCR